MFKAARKRLVDKGALTKDDAPSYFIECLLYNVPDHLFAQKLAPTYTGILKLAEDRQAQGLPVPERTGDSVRTTAGTMDSRQSADVRRRNARFVGQGGLSMEAWTGGAERELTNDLPKSRTG